jgi:hypothetical protein
VESKYDNETFPRSYKACTSFFRLSGTQLHPLIFLLEHYKHVIVGHRCASRHVELRANQVIPPAEGVVITASRTFNVESSNDEMVLKATSPLVLQGVVESSTLPDPGLADLPDPSRKWKIDINLFEHAIHS